MSQRSYLEGIGLWIALALITPVAEATDWYVDGSYSNCAASDGSQAKPFCRIRFANAAARNGDTIWIAAGTYADNFTVSKDLRMVGSAGAAATILDGGNSGRIIHLTTGADVTLEQLTLRNGHSGGADGGGCYVDGATLTVADCVFASNRCGIGLSSGMLTAYRCLFSLNVGNEGGAIRSYGTASTITVSDSRFEQNHAAFGGAIGVEYGATTTLERCVFVGNYSDGDMFHPGLGGAIIGDGITAIDCEFSDNVAHSHSGWGGVAGAVYLHGAGRFERCRFGGNIAESTFGQSLGGAIFLYQVVSTLAVDATFLDCEIAGSECGAPTAGVGGFGGGVYVGPNCVARFDRCTVAGNAANGTGTVTQGGTGGGIWSDPAALATSLHHTIVAANTAANSNGAPDVDGLAIVSLDWNVIGDATGATFSVAGANDLLDVDPNFVDPLLGDWSLQPISPAIDSGDPAIALGGKDVADFSRALDGDLDRVIRIDRGAHEFSHVRLAVTGTFAPGGTLTVDVTGSAGLPVLLVAGIAEAELALKPFGSLFVVLSLGSVVLPWGVVPNSTPITIDPALAVPLDVYVQALATAGRSGNLSNLVAFTIE